MAVPYELSADRFGSGKLSAFSTAGLVPEPNVGGCRISRTECPGIGGGVPVNVNSGQEDRSHGPTVVPESVPGAAAHTLEVDGPCGDVVRVAVVAPVDGELERPAVEVPGVPVDRKRLARVVRDEALGGRFGFQGTASKCAVSDGIAGNRPFRSKRRRLRPDAETGVRSAVAPDLEGSVAGIEDVADLGGGVVGLVREDSIRFQYGLEAPFA